MVFHSSFQIAPKQISMRPIDQLSALGFRQKPMEGMIRPDGVSINGGSPIAGWFISWNILFLHGCFTGTPHELGNLRMNGFCPLLFDFSL